MAEEWKHRAYIGSEFPENYRLETSDKGFIEVKGNPFKGLIKISIKTPNRENYQSVISNGIVIDERDLNAKRSKYLEDFFIRYQNILSSLPDQGLLKVISGNYGISEGESDQRQEKPNFRLKPSSFGERYRQYWKAQIRSIFKPPSPSDIWDSSMLVAMGLTVFSHNYDYLVSGIFTSTAAVFTGYCDWLIRKRNPYFFKIMTVLGLGIFAFYNGLMYQ